MTLFPAIVSTAMMLFMSLIIAVPIGVFSAIYLTEYSKANGKLIYAIRIFTDSLSGIPSIVFGLFGMLIFLDLFGFGRSVLAGSLTLVLIILSFDNKANGRDFNIYTCKFKRGKFGIRRF